MPAPPRMLVLLSLHLQRALLRSITCATYQMHGIVLCERVSLLPLLCPPPGRGLTGLLKLARAGALGRCAWDWA
eukprot:5249114-Pyramimonas_sp.AAC.1